MTHMQQLVHSKPCHMSRDTMLAFGSVQALILQVRMGCSHLDPIGKWKNTTFQKAFSLAKHIEVRVTPEGT